MESTPARSDPKNSHEAKAPLNDEDSKRLEDFGKWLFAVVGVVGTLGVTFSPAGLEQLGSHAQWLFVLAILSLSLSLALAVVGIVLGSRGGTRVAPGSLFFGASVLAAVGFLAALLVGARLVIAVAFAALAFTLFVTSRLVGRRSSTVGPNITGKTLIVASGLLFALALAGAGIGPFWSSVLEAQSERARNRNPHISFRLDGSGALHVDFSISGIQPSSPVKAALKVSPPANGLLLPVQRVFTDDVGRASLTLDLPDISNYKGTVLVVASWMDEDDLCVRAKKILNLPMGTESHAAETEPVHCRPIGRQDDA